MRKFVFPSVRATLMQTVSIINQDQESHFLSMSGSDYVRSIGCVILKRSASRITVAEAEGFSRNKVRAAGRE